MSNKINNYLIIRFSKIVFNGILISICLGLILNLFEEIEFFKNLNEGIALPFLLTMMYIPNLIIKVNTHWVFSPVSIDCPLNMTRSGGLTFA